MKKILLILCFFGFAFASLLDEGNKAYENGDFKKAAKIYKIILEDEKIQECLNKNDSKKSEIKEEKSFNSNELKPNLWGHKGCQIGKDCGENSHKFYPHNFK